MDMNFWGFAASYWWLVFPIMGVAGGIVRRWQVGSRERHQQRLEILAAKRDLKAVEADARAARREQVAAAPLPVGPEARADELRALFAQHDETTGRWLDYELDVAKLIAFPAMSDGRRPLTAAFLRAKRVADGLRPPNADASLSAEQLAAYREAVTDYGVKFDVAEQDARRQRDAGFSESERRRLERAEQLLKTALDTSATAAERQLAYKRVREELDGLIVLSDDAVTILESRVARQITTGPAPTSTSDAVPGAGSPYAEPLDPPTSRGAAERDAAPTPRADPLRG